MPYDLFISYSRRDNAQGRITTLVEHIKTDFTAFANRDLVPFFDQQEIHGMQDWRQRILQGLRESRLLLACLSPAYLQSEYCQWEFVEYLKYEIGHLHGFNGVAPIYFVEVPGWDSKDFEQKCAAWVTELRKRQHFDLRPWHDQGEEALREAAVQERMGKLHRQIVQTITRGERAEKSLGNVDAHNPHFIGRTAILRLLRENFVKPGHIGVVTAVNGVGGLGKTALAIEYAHAFADEYGGGRWQVRCAGKDDLRLALAELATPIGFEFTHDEKKNADLQFERTHRELKKLADAHEPHRCLLLLDNVDLPGLLDPAQVARLNGGDWLHVLATTRLGENELHGAHRDRSFLAIDELPPDDALALIESYQPDGRFHNEAEREAAREIVRLLGSFTLAVESAAVYLGQFANDVTCVAFLTRLKKEGLGGLDAAAGQSSEGVLHGEKRLSVTLQSTLERLDAAEKLALEFAALLPPDQVPLPWLRALVAKTFPEMERDAEPGYPDPWKNVVRGLFSLRLLTLGNHPEIVRIHRMVAAQLVAQVESKPRLDNDVKTMCAQRVKAIAELGRSSESWELDPLLAALLRLLRDCPDAETAAAAVTFFDILSNYRGFTEAGELLRAAVPCIAELSTTKASNVCLLHDLSGGLERLGDLAVAKGNCEGASWFFGEALSISESLLKAIPDSKQALRGLFVSHVKVGELDCRTGETTAAAEHFAKARELATRLNTITPNDNESIRDTAVALEKIGSLCISTGVLREAKGTLEESLAIRDRLVRESPHDPTLRRDLSVSLSLLGDLCQALEEPNERAIAYYEQCLKIRESLLSDDQENRELLWDISGCLGRLGMVAAKLEKLDEASQHFERSRDILAELVKLNPYNVPWRRDFAISFAKLADIASRRDHLESMDANFEACYAELEKIKQSVGELDEDLERVHQNFRTYLLSRIQDLQARGNQFYSANRDSEAVLLFRHALRLALLLHGDSHSLTATAWNSLGGALAVTGEVLEAEKCYRSTVFILGTLLRQSMREPESLRQALQNYDRFLRDIGLTADVVVSRVESVLRGDNVADLNRRET